MSRTRTAASAAAIALVGVALLAGCSSSSDSTSSAASAAASTAASASAGTQLPAPVMVAEDATTAECAVGNFLDILIPEDKLAGTTVSSSDEAIVTVTQGGQDGDAIFNPGGQCVAAGSATITVTNPDNTTREIAVTVS